MCALASRRPQIKSKLINFQRTLSSTENDKKTEFTESRHSNYFESTELNNIVVSWTGIWVWVLYTIVPKLPVCSRRPPETDPFEWARFFRNCGRTKRSKADTDKHCIVSEIKLSVYYDSNWIILETSERRRQRRILLINILWRFFFSSLSSPHFFCFSFHGCSTLDYYFPRHCRLLLVVYGIRLILATTSGTNSTYHHLLVINSSWSEKKRNDCISHTNAGNTLLETNRFSHLLNILIIYRKASSQLLHTHTHNSGRIDVEYKYTVLGIPKRRKENSQRIYA